MGATADRRLRTRASEALRHSRSGRVVILVAVATIIVFSTIIDAFAAFYLITDDIASYRGWSSVSNGVDAVINIVLLFLVWVLFETMSRLEREADRLQTFMDNTYRRLP